MAVWGQNSGEGASWRRPEPQHCSLPCIGMDEAYEEGWLVTHDCKRQEQSAEGEQGRLCQQAATGPACV